MSFKDPILNQKLKEAKRKLRKRGRKIVPHGLFGKNFLLANTFKNKFKSRCFDSKIEELRRLATIRIENTIPYEKRRFKRHSVFGMNCWVCGSESAHCQHHIIQLKNGGYDNGINRIPICSSCHEKIHDHLFIRSHEDKIRKYVDFAVILDNT